MRLALFMAVISPVVPLMVWAQTEPVPLAAPLSEAESYRLGEDLRQVVNLFINDSLIAGTQPAAVNFTGLFSQLAQSPQSGPEVELNFIRDLIQQYGHPDDRVLDPEQFRVLLNRDRDPVTPQQIAPGVMLLSLGELHSGIVAQVQEVLYLGDFSRGLILDLRGSVGYDPRVISDLARLFVPTTIAPLITTRDRFDNPTEWDSRLPSAAGNSSIAVLVNGETRQGAVLLAALLGQSSRVALMGQPTGSAGSQTQFYVLPSGAAVELAIASWQPANSPVSLNEGVAPRQFLADGQDWLQVAIAQLPPPLQTRQPQNIVLQEGRIGRFELGFDVRTVETGILGNVESFEGASGQNVFQPNSDLRIFYLQDYILLAYRNLGTVNSFFADRIYITDPAARTAEGLSIGDTYADMIRIYGRRGENGYNEISPFPETSRMMVRGQHYFVNYDALGIGFMIAVGSNRIEGIGLFKPGS